MIETYWKNNAFDQRFTLPRSLGEQAFLGPEFPFDHEEFVVDSIGRDRTKLRMELIKIKGVEFVPEDLTLRC